MKQENKKTIQKITTTTPEDWYKQTREHVKPHTTLTYTNNQDNTEWIIQIK